MTSDAILSAAGRPGENGRVDLATPTAVAAWLREHDIRPSRALGQNFLVDRNVRDRVIACAEVRSDDRVVEIGPGLGMLTAELATRGRHVTAIEKDGRLAALLRERFAGLPHVTIVEGDALTYDFEAAAEGLGRWIVVSNLPYVSGTRILVRLIQAAAAPARIVATLQKEVVDRLASCPGGRTYGLLSVWAQRFYAVRCERTISPRCFYPVPEVVSAVARLARRPDAPVAGDATARFYRVTKTAFEQRRKQLANVLPRAFPAANAGPARVREALESMGLDPAARAEALSADQWWTLVMTLGGGEAAAC